MLLFHAPLEIPDSQLKTRDVALQAKYFNALHAGKVYVSAFMFSCGGFTESW